MISFVEQLDELIGIAREAGDLEADLARLQRAADTHPARTAEGRNARRDLPNARAAVRWINAKLATARKRMIARVEAAA